MILISTVRICNAPTSSRFPPQEDRKVSTRNQLNGPNKRKVIPAIYFTPINIFQFEQARRSIRTIGIYRIIITKLNFTALATYIEKS